MDETNLMIILEAILMSAEAPLTIEDMQAVLDVPPEESVMRDALKKLGESYQERAIELKLGANGYSLQTKIKYSYWINRLYAEKPVKYSRALLETLAIIAYLQPVTRADIEEIRGVAVGSPIVKTLLEREWIKIAGYRDVPGKPAVYITTKKFLDYFNLKTINELPPLPGISQKEEARLESNEEEIVH